MKTDEETKDVVQGELGLGPQFSIAPDWTAEQWSAVVNLKGQKLTWDQIAEEIQHLRPEVTPTAISQRWNKILRKRKLKKKGASNKPRKSRKSGVGTLFSAAVDALIISGAAAGLYDEQLANDPEIQELRPGTRAPHISGRRRYLKVVRSEYKQTVWTTEAEGDLMGWVYEGLPTTRILRYLNRDFGYVLTPTAVYSKVSRLRKEVDTTLSAVNRPAPTRAPVFLPKVAAPAIQYNVTISKVGGDIGGEIRLVLHRSQIDDLLNQFWG